MPRPQSPAPLKKGLSSLDQRPSVVWSGPEALEAITEAEFSVVVCDPAMQQMNGWHLLGTVKDLCQGTGFPKPLFALLTQWGHEDKIIEPPSGSRYGETR